MTSRNTIKHPRFFVGIPSGGHGEDVFWMSMINMAIYECSKREPNPKDPIRSVCHLGSIMPQPGCYVGMNRSTLAVKAVNSVKRSGTTHLLMVDTDIKFQHDILDLAAIHVMTFPKAHIIAGRVNLANGYPVFYKDEYGGTVHQVQPFHGVMELTRVGTGIIIISVKCLTAMFKKFGGSLFNHLIIDGREYGDDFSFCTRARELGFKSYGAWAIKGIHHKMQPVPQNYPETIEELAPAFKKNT